MSKSEIELLLFIFGLLMEEAVSIAVNNDVDFYRVIYLTADPAGQLTEASALMTIPGGGQTALPMIAYQHETIVHRNDAPTQQELNLSALGLAAGGYFTVLADYLGFGVSHSLHPIANAHSLAVTIIDAIRSSRLLAKQHSIALDEQLFLMGYSEGGYATLALQREIQKNYSTEFSVTASAPMAGPYDISGTMVQRFLDPTPHPNPYFFPYLILSGNQVYGFFDSLDSIFLPLYNESILDYYI